MEYYSDNDFRMYHSFKGTTWKNHKYVSKKNVLGNTRYIYDNSPPPYGGDTPIEGYLREETRNDLNEKADYSHDMYEINERSKNEAVDSSRVWNEDADFWRDYGKYYESIGEPEKARLAYENAAESQRFSNSIYQKYATPATVKAKHYASEEERLRKEASDIPPRSISKFESAVNSLGDYLKKIRISW